MSTFFFDPHDKARKPLDALTLTLDKTFLLGFFSDEGGIARYALSFTDGSGVVIEQKGHGPHTERRFRVTPRLPGKHALSADGPSLELISIDVSEPKHFQEDMVYTGSTLAWFHNTPKGTSGPLQFVASSGLTTGNPVDEGRNSKFQTISNRGPIPEGLYTFFARRDPRRYATILGETSDGDIALDGRDGIQILPHDKKMYTFAGWGKHRVKLSPAGWNAAPNRNGFYLHDSHKGFTHGCIEVPDLFKSLNPYADGKQGPAWLKVRVSYGGSEVSTKGNTLRPIAPGEYDAPAAD